MPENGFDVKRNLARFIFTMKKPARLLAHCQGRLLCSLSGQVATMHLIFLPTITIS
jgi:hypothetical protein